MLRRTVIRGFCAHTAVAFLGIGGVTMQVFGIEHADIEVLLKTEQSGDASQLLKKIAAAKTQGVRKIRIQGDVDIFEPLIIPSEIEVIFDGVLRSHSKDATLLLENVTDVVLRFHEILGDGVTEQQSGVAIRNSSDCTVYGSRILSILNKGVEISSTNDGRSERNLVSIDIIRGAIGKSGAGVSIFGKSSAQNRIEGGVLSGNRIGITINGGMFNQVRSVTCSNNLEAGAMIDGMVSRAADGGSHNVLRSLICNSNGSANAAYGGVYLGNGSSFNEIIDLVAEGNFGAGCRLSGGDSFQNKGNKFEHFRLHNNQRGGFVASESPGSTLIDVIAEENGLSGIALFKSDDSNVSGRSDGNGADGLLIQSANVEVLNFLASGNKGYGIHVAYGGSNSPNAKIHQFSGNGNVRGPLYLPSSIGNK